MWYTRTVSEKIFDIIYCERDHDRKTCLSAICEEYLKPQSGNQNGDVHNSISIHSIWTQLLWFWPRGLGNNDNRQLIRSHVRHSLLTSTDFDTGFCYMITSSNGNIFRVTGPLCGEFTGRRWIPPHKGQWRRALMFSLICHWIDGWVNNREAGDLRRHRAYYDVIVMLVIQAPGLHSSFLETRHLASWKFHNVILRKHSTEEVNIISETRLPINLYAMLQCPFQT